MEKANDKIRELEGKDIFRILFESAGEGLLLVDRNGSILMVNPRIEEMFGFEKEELTGKQVEILMPEIFRHKHAQYRDTYTARPKKRSMGHGMDLQGQKKDGRSFPVEISLNYFFSGGEMVVMALITDISERKDAEEKLHRLNEELEKRVEERTQMLAGVIHELEYTNKSLEKAEEEVRQALEKEKELGELKSRFVSTASHEFRTPLATILSSVSLIAKYDKPEDAEKRNKHIERIKSSVQNLREILNDFLSVGKLEEGKVEIRPERFSVKELGRTICDEMQMIAKPGQKISFTFSDNDKVNLDPQITRNVIINLLSNAIKFSDEKKTISLSTEVTPGLLKISVSDEGMGMSEEDQRHLFERFFRAKNAINVQGTGLGLNIVKKYVELMEGEITFKSELNKGTTFFVKLPFIQ